MSPAGLRIRVRGTVQGVGFRPWVVRLAQEHGVQGTVWNDGAGVVIEAFAAEPGLASFVGALQASPPPAARLTHFAAEPVAAPDAPPAGFHITDSREAPGAVRVTVPPDLPTCEACLAELLDPADRRFGYPFINCTSCGPRYTLVQGLPYDRPKTTMARFTMCPACQAEYDDVRDRRYHAQPNACPACGPRLTLLTPEGREVPGKDPLAAAASALQRGQVVAVKGLGGFHLAVDATRDDAVRLLRQRKRREEKPFAVMVADLDEARALAHVDAAEARLLAGTERPIVLVRRREGGPLSPSVSPCLQRVGLMLPYTPLHHLLLRLAARPLVMTSGNLSEEPLARTNAEALARLGPLCDLLLVHDRDIEARADDSVAHVLAGRPQLLRRSRGYVVRGTPLPTPVRAPVLACGAHLKATFCLATGDAAYLSPHVGDLENLETLEAYELAVARLERLLEVAPAVVAHDLHPQYLSTRYARGRTGVTLVGVQHHHAHVVSGMVEHGLTGRALGLAWDGTGLGTDGAAWGSELLLCDARGFTRLATFRPLRLAGGDKAVRDVWRSALALLDDAFDGAPPVSALRLFDRVPEREVRLVRDMVRTGLNAPLAHGAGRYFDAVGALAFARPHVRFEGQLAMMLEQAAEGEVPAYAFALARGEAPGAPLEVDLRPALRAVVEDLLAGVEKGWLSARFHQTLVDAGAAVVARARAEHGDLPVVLTGGCFQNARLAAGLSRALGPAALLHSDVPAGDGGLALGQAVVADAVVHGA